MSSTTWEDVKKDVVSMDVENDVSYHQIIAYVLVVVNSKGYNMNPKEYMDEWKIRRGRTEELRLVEDTAYGIVWNYTKKVFRCGISPV